jgi:uncharacterized membrane-anchored protein
MKTPILWIFLAACLAQWAAPLSSIWQREQVLKRGELIRVKCAAPDPYDPLRGRFLAVRPAQDRASITPGTLADLRAGTDAFALLRVGGDGLAEVAEISPSRPAGGMFVKVRLHYVTSESANFRWPFDRFFLNEKLAPEADVWLAENLRGEKPVVAEVRVLNGQAVLQDLTVEGRSFREILLERRR